VEAIESEGSAIYRTSPYRLLPPQSLALDFQLADAAFDLVEFSGHGAYMAAI